MKPIGIDHFAKFSFLNHLKVSDTGKAAFLVKKANLEENGYDSDLYLWQNGQPCRLTDTGKVSDFYWVERLITILLISDVPSPMVIILTSR